MDGYRKGRKHADVIKEPEKKMEVDISSTIQSHRKVNNFGGDKLIW